VTQRDQEVYLLVATAMDVFHDHGVDAPLDDIARRAGLGSATMYRHFPTRRDVIIAVYSKEVAELFTRSQSLLAEDRPGDALFGRLQGLHRTRSSQAVSGAVDHR
jgi:AcrR family transcriptional regulator